LEERAHTLGEHRHEFIMRRSRNEINRSMLLCSRDFLRCQIRKTKLMVVERSASTHNQHRYLGVRQHFSRFAAEQDSC
jgi:hypothetical protein